MLEKQMKKEYESGLSVSEIAKKYNFSESKVLRTLKKIGTKIRSRSEAAKMALKTGRSVSPTQGKGHSKASRERMSVARAEAWKKGGQDAKNEMSEIARARWSKKSDAEKTEMLSRAGRALRKTADEGSAAEKYLFNTLVTHGYTVERHNTQLMAGEYEIDLLLPQEGIVIEIDGPQHFEPIFGDERFEKTKIYDTTKNGALIAKGLKVIRIKYVAKRFNESVGRRMWNALEKVLQSSNIKKLTYVSFD